MKCVRFVLAATCLTLAGGVSWVAAQSPVAGSPAAAVPQAGNPGAGLARHTAEVQRLQHAVAAGEAKREEALRRLQQQDREIESLRRQLQTASGHDSVPQY